MSQGIFGIIDFNKRIESPDKLATTLGRFLQGNGAGQTRVSCKWDHHYILGMKRICRAPYQQDNVFQNSRTDPVCLMHGEIHNFESVLEKFFPEQVDCQGDLDLGLRLYHSQGPQFAKNFNGLFCLGILDQKENTFILANDRFGMAHQVYWTVMYACFCFPTHLKTLLS